jgi:hypothetical protein
LRGQQVDRLSFVGVRQMLLLVNYELGSDFCKIDLAKDLEVVAFRVDQYKIKIGEAIPFNQSLEGHRPDTILDEKSVEVRHHVLVR